MERHAYIHDCWRRGKIDPLLFDPCVFIEPEPVATTFPPVSVSVIIIWAFAPPATNNPLVNNKAAKRCFTKKTNTRKLKAPSKQKAALGNHGKAANLSSDQMFNSTVLICSIYPNGGRWNHGTPT
jgi:hypothetical protein